MAYLYLLFAIFFEIIATASLKASEQFTRFWPMILVIIGYASSFYCLSLTLKTIPMGIAYALWSGIGIVLISLVGLFWFKQQLDLPAFIGITFILLGVLVIHVFSHTMSH